MLGQIWTDISSLLIASSQSKCLFQRDWMNIFPLRRTGENSPIGSNTDATCFKTFRFVGVPDTYTFGSFKEIVFCSTFQLCPSTFTKSQLVLSLNAINWFTVWLLVIHSRRFIEASRKIVFAPWYRLIASLILFVPDTKLSTYMSLFSFSANSLSYESRWHSTVAPKRNGLVIIPNGTRQNLYSWILSLSTLMWGWSFNHRNLVTSLWLGCKPICRNAFFLCLLQ